MIPRLLTNSDYRGVTNEEEDKLTAVNLTDMARMIDSDAEDTSTSQSIPDLIFLGY